MVNELIGNNKMIGKFFNKALTMKKRKARSHIAICIVLIFTLHASSIQAFGSLNSEGKNTFSPNTKVVNSDFQEFHFEVNASFPIISRSSVKGDQVKINGFDTIGIPGHPQLPVKSYMVAIPPDGDYELNYSSSPGEILEGDYRIQPALTPVQMNYDLQPGTWKSIADDSISGSDDFYPQKPVQIMEEGWFRDIRYVRLEVYPLQYSPGTNQIRYFDDFSIWISFERGLAPSANKQENPGVAPPPIFEKLYEKQFLNYEIGKNWISSDRSFDQRLMNTESLGDRFRISITENGIYKITYDDLLGLGMDITQIDPVNLQLFNQWREVAVIVSGQSDGSFDPGDEITFFGEEFSGDTLSKRYETEDDDWLTYIQQLPDGSLVSWKPEQNSLMMEKYTDENVYWLVKGESPGLRMETINGDPSGISIDPVTTYTDTLHEEESKRWYVSHFTGEESFYWIDLNTNNLTHTFTSTITNMQNWDPSNATIRGEMITLYNNYNSSPDHHARFYLNSTQFLESTWDGISRLSFENQIDPSLLHDGVNEFTVELINDTSTTPRVFFDWYEIEFSRNLIVQNDQINFGNQDSGQVKFEIGGFNNLTNPLILDVTNPITPIKITSPEIIESSLEPRLYLPTVLRSNPAQVSRFNQSTFSRDSQVIKSPDGIDSSTSNNEDVYTLMFGVEQTAPADYYITDGQSIRVPDDIKYYPDPGLLEPNPGAEYILITHPDLMDASQQLADYRQSNGYSTMLVNIQDLYNEFTAGITNPLAIKDFLRYAYDFYTEKPSYVVLIGDGHWNMNYYQSNYFSDEQFFIPPYQAYVDPWMGEVDSTNSLATIVGDDPLADVMIGRIPVNSPEELITYINKVITYESLPNGQDWQKNFTFIADNIPDTAGDFVALSEAIIADYITPSSSLDATKIYQNDFDCTSTGSPECLNVTAAISSTYNQTGTLLLNYSGHAAINRWSSESIWMPDDISSLSNDTKTPVILSMTCLDGYWLGPELSYVSPSLSELSVLDGNGGAIAAFSPTGLGVASGHDDLQRGFYDSLLENGLWDLGSASMNAKLNLYNTGSNFDLLKTYLVLGDPALQIKRPYDNRLYLPYISR